ncbi:MAG TPA: hypothetical protein VMJ13_11880 [Candidatus Acidoferrum sp.]|nr:hypothetical protein [Candidatus Acidoferrum sp.]
MDSSLSPALNQANTLEHVQVARNGGKRNAKRLGQGGNATFATG